MNPSHSELWQRWRNQMATLGCAEQRQTYEKLMTAYSEPQRHYHALDHLRDCLGWVTKILLFLENPVAVELALWFHDAIYQPRSKTNEIESAAWGRTFLEDAEVSGAIAKQVSTYILATQTHEASANLDCKFVLDIDLTILGSSPERFRQFESQIREEYQWVPLTEYREKRTAILQKFLGKPTIYQTVFFVQRFEKQARENIKGAIAALSSDSK